MKGQIFKRAGRAQIAIAGVGHVQTLNLGQTIGTPGAEVIENHLANHAENRDVRADSECQRGDCNGSEGRRLAKTS